MRDLALILRARRRREAAARRRWSVRFRLWGLGALMALGLLAAAVGAAAAWGYASLTTDLPSPAMLPAYLDTPAGLLLQPTRFWDAQGHLLAGSPSAPPTYLDPERLPPCTVEAILTAVDPNFWEEHGYPGHFWQTHLPPSISERLALQLLLPHEPPSLRRRLRARILAAQMLATFGHPRVLTWYLNIADFGHNLYGLEAASRAYLGKPAAELTLSEAALLAATLPNPALNPWDAPRQAEQARQQLLLDMVAAGRLPAEQAADALAETPSIRPPENAIPAAPLALAQRQLDAFDWPLPERGLDVHTTVDSRLQAEADCLQQAVRAAQTEAPNCPAARLLPPALIARPLPADADLEGLVMEVATGRIIAYSAPQGLPRAHAVGSALSPWVYAVAFTRGFAPASLTWDIPAALPSGVQAANPDGQFHGPMRLRFALANDDLVPTLHLLDQLIPSTVWATAARIGLPALQQQEDAGFGVLLGQGRLTLPQIAHGISAFAALGHWHGLPVGQTLAPSLLTQAVDAQGNLRINAIPTRQDVLSAGVAYLITDILSDQAAKWRSLGHPNPLELGRPLAVHLGRAPDGGVWVLGYTPQRVVAVYARTTDPARSRDAALAYWHALARAALADLPPQRWEQPPQVTTIAVCDPSGLLPTADCPSVVEELFLQGNEPTAPDSLYRRIPIDRETGLRATVFTPPQLVEPRVFMVVPPEAEAWAREAGLPLPPADYDRVALPQPSPNATITSPAPFSTVRGKVTWKGTAAGADFASYRLQAGRGLNPNAWVVLAEGQRPIHNGILGTWDTSGLSGLYTVQLLVIGKSGEVRTFTTQITVDTLPPTVGFAAPQPGEPVEVPHGGHLIVQAAVADDLALAWVRLSADGRPIDTLYAPPYTFAVMLPAGEHTLTLTAADQAGNENTATTTVTVRETNAP